MLQLNPPVASDVEKGTEVDFHACLEGYFAEHLLDDVQCSQCQKKTQFTERYRFIRYPKTLCVVLQRFAVDGWVPKKLDIEVKVPEATPLNLETLKSANNGKAAEGEETFPEPAGGDELEEPELNQTVLNELLQMGLPEVAAKHAVYNAGSGGAEAAAGWYFEHMDDPTVQEPLKVKKAGAGAAKGDEVPAESLSMMMAMGFPEKKCRKALRSCDMNVERATDWLFSHMDDPDSDGDGDSVMANEEAKQLEDYKCDRPGVYNLQSFITHLGASVHAGHYVCHINKSDAPGGPKRWVYFNDAKVAETTEPPIGKGYLYFFEKA